MSELHSRLTRQLDFSSPAEIEAFERAFYEGFAHATHNRLVRWLWEWDHAARRLRTRIPYSEQQAWALVDASGALCAVVSANVRLRTLQSAAYGFAVPPELASDAAAGRVCEFLTFFAVGEHSLRTKHALWRRMFDDLRAANFTHALATTAPKAMPMYRYLGVKVIGETQIEDETRFFLDFDLAARPEGEGADGLRLLAAKT